MHHFTSVLFIVFLSAPCFVENLCSPGDQNVLLRCQQFCAAEPDPAKLLPCGYDCFDKMKVDPSSNIERKAASKCVGNLPSENSCDGFSHSQKEYDQCKKDKYEKRTKEVFDCILKAIKNN